MGRWKRRRGRRWKRGRRDNVEEKKEGRRWKSRKRLLGERGYGGIGEGKDKVEEEERNRWKRRRRDDRREEEKGKENGRVEEGMDFSGVEQEVEEM